MTRLSRAACLFLSHPAMLALSALFCLATDLISPPLMSAALAGAVIATLGLVAAWRKQRQLQPQPVRVRDAKRYPRG